MSVMLHISVSFRSSKNLVAYLYAYPCWVRYIFTNSPNCFESMANMRDSVFTFKVPLCTQFVHSAASDIHCFGLTFWQPPKLVQYCSVPLWTMNIFGFTGTSNSEKSTSSGERDTMSTALWQIIRMQIGLTWLYKHKNGWTVSIREWTS